MIFHLSVLLAVSSFQLRGFSEPDTAQPLSGSLFLVSTQVNSFGVRVSWQTPCLMAICPTRHIPSIRSRIDTPQIFLVW